MAVNDIVVSVNELPDGTATSVVNESDISRELKILRETAYAFGMPSVNSINWTLGFIHI